ncbi:E3 ubiquitin-protein ligase APD2-like isoform X1 [Corylus avellana]|uniref:E3 ubiquitin-protein ligase APD2-like isoform X1 n=1 Tax=Corylus avellana TaxID=13451 RepID=UPI001E2156F7|nr:E3 ubiquitin-protein ligase APD2-like isoform X1 [Corylus avellana]
MCSTVHVMDRIKLHLGSSSPSFNLTTPSEDDFAEWCFTLAFVGRLFAYFAALAFLAVVMFMVMKYIENFGEERATGEVGATETSPLWPGKTAQFTYGTCDGDLESGNCTSSGGASSSSSSNSNSSEDLYDKKVCVICYDEQRNCFFVPCGHCATCHVCAQRIFNGENKTCPVCRRLIGKVRKLIAPQD